jgi:hypothetical protein
MTMRIMRMMSAPPCLVISCVPSLSFGALALPALPQAESQKPDAAASRDSLPANT